jgi:hypothetical protein
MSPSLCKFVLETATLQIGPYYYTRVKGVPPNEQDTEQDGSLHEKVPLDVSTDILWEWTPGNTK